MTRKKLLFGDAAQDALIQGANIVADAVTATYGPVSGNVGIDAYPLPEILHDGVSVAESIRLEDYFQDMGAVLLAEAARKTNTLAGDGTTTATLLAQVLLRYGLKMIRGDLSQGIIERINPMILRNRLLKFSDDIDERLTKMAIKAKTKEDRKRIATISCGDEELGEIISEVLEKVGGDGVVMVEDGSDFETIADYESGYEFSNGFLSPQFMTDPVRKEVNYSGGEHFVLLTEKAIVDGMTLVPILEKVAKVSGGKSALLVVADDVTGPALQALALSKIKAGLKVVAVKAPEYGARRAQMLEDLAILTGGRVYGLNDGSNLDEIQLSDLGRARGIKVNQTHTNIIPKSIDHEELKDRIKEIRDDIKNSNDRHERERQEMRLAKLSQKVAIITVGGASDTEIGNKRERIIDAVNATKAAISEGYVPGGGVALYRIFRDQPKSDNETLDGLFSEFLRAPFSKLIENAGEDVGEFLKKLEKQKDQNVGYNLISGEWVNMLDAGIIDPAKVTRLAVKHAIGVASMILTTKVLIANAEQKDIQNIRVVNNQ